MTATSGLLTFLIVVVCVELTSSTEDTLTVKEAVATDVELPTKRLRRADFFDSDEDIEVYQDNHTYYHWRVFKPAKFDDYWVELQDDSKHHYLSNSFDKAHRSNVTFDFLFYGHEINVVGLTTAGFISTSNVLHNKMFQTQYISPYMANFDPSKSANSTVLFEIIGETFVVEWKDVYILQRHRHEHGYAGPYTFQTSVHKNGTIVFAYKEMPFVYHDARIGLVEGMYFTTHIQNVFRYYNYGQVKIDPRTIQAQTVVVLTPKPTCNLAMDCRTCVTQDIGFNCKWCDAVQRCSDGTDRGTQEWYRSACYHNATKFCDGPPFGDHSARPSTESVAPSTETSRASQAVTTTGYQGPQTSTDSHKQPTTTHKDLATTEHGARGTSTTVDTWEPTVQSTSESEVSLTTDGWITTTGGPYSSVTDAEDERANIEASRFSSDDSVDEPASSNTVLVVVLVLIIVCVAVSVCGLFFYAYTHPSSRPAIWLLEHRPNNLVARWRRRKDQPEPQSTESTPVA